MSILLASDFHLGHRRIIEYCDRPFKSVEAMDITIIRWLRETVSPVDILMFLGDFSFGGSKRRKKYSEIIFDMQCGFTFIKGNHDGSATSIMRDFDLSEVHNFIEMDHAGYKMILIHNPRDVKNPEKYDIIFHGHTHNSTPKFDGKYVNMCVEHWDYKPVKLETVIKEWEKYIEETKRCSS